jgi:hypothetical protein
MDTKESFKKTRCYKYFEIYNHSIEECTNIFFSDFYFNEKFYQKISYFNIKFFIILPINERISFCRYRNFFNFRKKAMIKRKQIKIDNNLKYFLFNN